jgi:hypothetical protein
VLGLHVVTGASKIWLGIHTITKQFYKVWETRNAHIILAAKPLEKPKTWKEEKIWNLMA